MEYSEQLKASLAAIDPDLMDLTDMGHAAVAIILRFIRNQPEVLLIERAENDNDPWSGHLALPGGRVESYDASPQQAAEREALEETGVSLAPEDCLGRLSDINATGVPVVVSCFVYSCSRDFEFRLDAEEVADAFWVPLSIIDDPDFATRVRQTARGGAKSFPAIKVPGRSQPLWGITFSLLKELVYSARLNEIYS